MNDKNALNIQLTDHFLFFWLAAGATQAKKNKKRRQLFFVVSHSKKHLVELIHS